MAFHPTPHEHKKGNHQNQLIKNVRIYNVTRFDYYQFRTIFGSGSLRPSKSHDQSNSDGNADEHSQEEAHFVLCVIATGNCGCVSEIITRKTLGIQRRRTLLRTEPFGRTRWMEV